MISNSKEKPKAKVKLERKVKEIEKIKDNNNIINADIKDKKKKMQGTPDILWNKIAENFDMVEGAQFSNSFIILKLLDEADRNGEEGLNSTELSERLAINTQARVFKISATLRDSLEKRFRPMGFVEAKNIPSNGTQKKVKKTIYKITPKGKELLKGWIAFIQAY